MFNHTPVIPPITKPIIKPIGKNSGTSNFIVPHHIVSNQLNVLIPEGTAINEVNIENNVVVTASVAAPYKVYW